MMASSLAAMIYFCLFFVSSNPLLTVIDHKLQNLYPILVFFAWAFLFMEWVFIAYIGGILIVDRKEEFQLYRFLGISKYQIAGGVFFETCFIQFISWITGFVLATLFSKLFGMILMKLMEVNRTYNLYINWKLIQESVAVFCSFTILLALLNFFRVIIRKQKIKQSRNWQYLRYALGLMGFVLIVYGYLQAGLHDHDIYKIGNINALNYGQMIPIFFEVVIGTYFFYVGFVDLLVTILKKISLVKYSGIRNLSGNLFDKSIRKNVSSLWLITVISGTAIVMLFLAVMTYQVMLQDNDTNYSYDVVVNKRQISKVKELALENNQEIKTVKSVNVKQIIGKEEGKKFQVLSFVPYHDYKNSIGKKSQQYNAKIKKNQIMTLNAFRRLENDKKNTHQTYYLSNGRKIESELTGDAMPIGSDLYYGRVLVVPDQIFKSLSSKKQDKIYGINLKGSIRSKFTRALNNYLYDTENGWMLYSYFNVSGNQVEDVKIDVTTPPDNEKKAYYYKSGVNQNYQRNQTEKQTRGSLIFIFSILSIVFIIALGSILSIKQFVENRRNVTMYETLKKIGIGQTNINHLIVSQTALLFFLPMGLAVSHAVFAINYVMKFSFNIYWTMFLVILCGYLLMYAGLFLATSIVSKRQINQKISQ